MNKLYENVAKAIRMNTFRNSLETNSVDKIGLVETLTNYFKKTDTLFNPDDFAKECDYMNPDEFAKENKEGK